MDREAALLKTINRLPPELVRYIKAFLPISILKKVRKIHNSEFPINYRICIDINHHFYKKYIGCDIDIQILKMSIELLKKKRIQQNKPVINPFSHSFWQNSPLDINKEIETKIQSIEYNKRLMDHYLPYYFYSTLHAYNHKIIELD